MYIHSQIPGGGTNLRPDAHSQIRAVAANGCHRPAEVHYLGSGRLRAATARIVRAHIPISYCAGFVALCPKNAQRNWEINAPILICLAKLTPKI